MLCPNCESENRENAKFCDQCGFPLTGAIARVASSAMGAQRSELDASASIVDDGESAYEAEMIPGHEPEPERVHVEFDEPDEIATTNDEVFAETPDAEELDADAPAPLEDEEGLDDDTAVIPVEEVVDAASGEESKPDASEELIGLPAEDANSESGANPTMSIGEGPGGADPTMAIVTGKTDADRAFHAGKTVAIGADLSGFDRPSDEYGERLVGPGYTEPTVDWRDGGTMKMPAIEDGESGKGKDYLASSTKKKSNKHKIVLWSIIAALAVVAIALFATYQMQLWGGISVPDVVGMTEADAKSVLEDQGFSVRSTQVKSDETEGLVLVMDPESGSRVDEGAEIVIHVSNARVVPDVSGMTEEQARQALAAEGFDHVTASTKSSDAQAGTVLTVSPEIGSRAKSVQEIALTIAKPFVVPDIYGMYLSDAQQAISNAGLKSDITYVETTDYPDGVIMGSDPAAGSEVRSDTVVWILISRARGAELERLTSNYLAPGNTVSLGFYNYQIESVDSVQYEGNNRVSFTITARPFTYILGETVSISARQVSGEAVWSDSNELIGLS